MTAAEISARLRGRIVGHGQYLCRCPVPTHGRQRGDRNPSLSLADGQDGRLLVHCHAGCAPQDVFAELRRLGLISAGRGEHAKRSSDFAKDAGSRGGSAGKRKSYDYSDADGTLLHQVVRFEPKDFRQRRPDGRGGWIWNLNGVRRVLYRLPELIEAIANGHVVLIVEGEKDVDTLCDLGVVATTNSGGAGKWRDEYNDYLSGADVVILPDNDEPGRTHANEVAASLQGVATRVRIVELPGLPANGDVSDWIAAGNTLEALWQLVDAAPEWRPAEPDSGHAQSNGQILESVCAADIVPRAVRWLWPERFALGKLGIIGGLPDQGKGLIAAYMIAQATKGGAWPCGEGSPRSGRLFC
jgi:hypothetical protein